MDKKTVFAWHLSDVDGNDWRVMVMDNYVLIGWGFLANELTQWTAYRFKFAVEAHAFATRNTELKEQAGFDMDPIRQGNMPEGLVPAIEALVGKKAQHTWLNSLWGRTMIHGLIAA